MTVYFIGAGPGDPELLTIKGQRLIRRCPVILYAGSLVPDAVLADHDRVEIYRPLLVDPKVSRQRRVEKTRKAGSIEGRRWQNKDSR